MKKQFLAAILTATLATLLTAAAPRHAAAAEWKPRAGETIVYDMKLYRMTLANQTMKIEGTKKVSGRDCLRVTSATKSVPLAKRIMEIDDLNESCLDPASLTPVEYRSRIRETGWKSDTVITFAKGKITIDEIRGENLDEKRHTDLKPKGPVLDDVSIITNLRGRNVKVGDSFSILVVSEREIQNAKVTVLREEELNTKIGKRKVLVVKSTFSDALFWIDSGPDRIPLKFEVQTKAGRVQGIIKSYTPGK